MNMMKEIIDRVKAPTPTFWKKMRNLGVAIGSSAFTVFMVNKTFELGLPEKIITVSTYVFTACAALVGSALLTKQDGLLPKEDEKPN